MSPRRSGPRRRDTGEARNRAAKARGFEKPAEGFPQVCVVVHDEDDMVVRHHAAALASTGNVKMNVAPHGSFFSTHNRPP